MALNLLFDGDGNVSGLAGRSFVDRLMAYLPKDARVANMAVPASKLADVDARRSSYPSYQPGDYNVYGVWADTQDLATGTAAWPQLVALRQLCRAMLPWSVIVFTTLPRSDPGIVPTFESTRQQYNAALRDQWWQFADALVDVASGQLGVQTFGYHTDKIHLAEPGMEMMTPYVLNAVMRLSRQI